MQQTVIDGRYTLIKPLGGGGMARVYLAHDEVLDRDVALKVLRDQYADDEEFVERFRREARSAASLSHPNIVSVYDQGRSKDGDYYMAMEYVPKGTLKDRIKRDGALAPLTAAGVAIQICEALSAAHSNGVIHRDIKPQNVLVTEAGDIKVADFGIAKAAAYSTATATGVVLGTAGYMSPEQAKGEPVGPQSDLYSLGVVLYEMLTGNLPYEADSALVQAMKHVNEPPPSPREANPEVSKDLDALTMRLLAKEPKDRYPSADALAGDLDRICSGLSPTAPKKKENSATTAPLPPPARTRRKVVRPPVAAPARASGRDGRRRGRYLPLLVALLFAALLLGGLGLALTQGLFGGLGGPQEESSSENPASTVEVPELYWSVDAPSDLENASLRLGSRYTEASPTVPVNAIIYSIPAQGTEVEEDTAVDIYVSTGPQEVSPAPIPEAAPTPQAAPTPPPPAAENQKAEDKQKGKATDEIEERIRKSLEKIAETD